MEFNSGFKGLNLMFPS